MRATLGLMPAQPLLPLHSTQRYQLVLAELNRRYPGCLSDPSVLPATPDYLPDLVFDSLENAGLFAQAGTFLRQIPPATWGRIRHEDDLDRVDEKARYYAPLATLMAQQGRVTTLAKHAPRRVRLADADIDLVLDLPGQRLDVELAGLALTRMKAKLKTRFDADPGPLLVEVHASEDRFRDRAAELHGRDLPEHVHGLALSSDNVLLVFHRPHLGVDPASLFVRLRHEYTHIALASLAPDRRISAWLDEGLAIALTSRIPRPMLELWDRAGHAALPVTDQELNLPTHKARRELACVQADLFARRLLDRGDDLVAEGIAAGWTTSDWLAALEQLESE